MQVEELSEAGRLATLHEYGLLDQPADAELTAVIRVAAAVAQVPNATLNLLDADRQCQLTTVGFDGCDTPRQESMCHVGVTIGGFVHIPDATLDPRFARNVWVTGVRGRVRFYAAAPLTTPQGHVLGTLCVFDSVPRQLTQEQQDRLTDLAAVVLALFERRRQTRAQAELAAQAERARRELAVTHHELAVRTQFLDAVLDSIDVAVVAVDPQGHLTMFNRAARNWHGLDADPTVSPAEISTHYHLYEGDGSTPLSAGRLPLLRALRDGAVNGAELVIAPHDRPATSALASGRRLVGPDGAIEGAVIAMTDVTASRAAQRQLLQLNSDLVLRTAQLDASIAELKRSNNELGSIAAVASHDLLAPLAVVNAYLEELGECYGDRLDEQAGRWLATMIAAIGRMRELMESLMGYAQAGSKKLRAEATQLDDVVRQVSEDLRPRLDAAAAQLRSERLPVVYGDPVALRQLLQNLIDNALKFRHPDRPSVVRVYAERGQDSWVIAVADNGQGIPAGLGAEVFAMFTRARAETIAGVAGHGIGLATCERIVSRHGGVIWADDTPGGGATIRFSLPDPAPDRVTP